MRGRRALCCVAAAVALVVASLIATPPVGAAGEVTVTAEPKWGPVGAGSWTPYSVTLGNQGGVDVVGEVVLVPSPEPPPKPGARPTTTTTTPAPTSTTVVALGGRAVTAPVPRGPWATAEPSRWPTYRAAVSLPAGTDKTLTLMVLEAPFGYTVEVRDGSGARLATAQGPEPAGSGCTPRLGDECNRTRLLLLSDVDGAGAALEAMPQQVVSQIEAVQLRAARDFPDTAIHLASLDVVVIDDFDTATLSATQRDALGDYVSLGGSLLLTGGAAWSRALPALPPGLSPLRPTGTTESVSLAPLADLVAATTTAAATVVTGDIAAGRAVLSAPGGPPLVIQADHGMGRVVQLAYDPMAQPLASDELLRRLAWEQGLARVDSPWGGFVSGSIPQTVAEDQLWASTFAASPWPSWPGGGRGLLVLYAVLIGPATFLLSRRSRARKTWIAVPLAALLAAGGCLFATRARTDSATTVVEVQTLGADGRKLTTTYSGILALDPSDAVPLGSGGAASSVFTSRPPFRPIGGQLDPLNASMAPERPVSRGLGGGTVEVGAGGATTLRLATEPWQLRTVQTLSVGGGGPVLEAKLRLVGASRTSPGRVTGTVTNRGRTAITTLRAQIIEGQARLADILEPGATIEVDAPIVTTTNGASGGSLLPATPDETAMFAAASRSFSAPAQVALVGISPSQPGTTPGVRRRTSMRRSTVVVGVVPLESAEKVLAGTGGARLVATALGPGGAAATVAELVVPAGTPPLSLRYPARLTIPGQPEPPQLFFEVFDWRTATWRTLPPMGRPRYAYTEAPLADSEVDAGLVRIRQRGADALGFFVGISAQLLLTSDSDAAAGPP